MQEEEEEEEEEEGSNLRKKEISEVRRKKKCHPLHQLIGHFVTRLMIDVMSEEDFHP